MAGPFEATSQWRATFYVHQQTFNLVTTPALTACNFAHDSFITHRHKIYAFTLPALLGLLQIQSAGNTTRACVFGILAYYLTFRAWLCLPLYATQLGMAMSAFGSFSLASLVSLLLSDSWWHIKYIFYVLLVLVELHKAVTVLYDKYVRRFILTMRAWRTSSAMHLLPMTYRDLRLYDA